MAKKNGNGEGGITRHKGSGLYMARYTVQTPTGPKRKTLYGKTREVLSNVVDRPLWSRGVLLLVPFYQLPIPELGSSSYERHQMMSV